MRRLCVGGMILLISAAAVAGRAKVTHCLQHRPWLVIPAALGQVLLVSADDAVSGPFVAWSLTSLGPAVISARARSVWLFVVLLMTAYGACVLTERSPADLVEDGDLSGVVGAVIAYPVTALVLMVLRNRYAGFSRDHARMLADVRRGTPAFTPALQAVIAAQGAGKPRSALPPPRTRLTATERSVVENLAAGSAPKQVAHRWGVSITTVRTHIRHAKRKTGARTLRELAALAADPSWPEAYS